MKLECELMDGVKILPLLPKSGQWKTWCGNRTVTRKSFI